VVGNVIVLYEPGDLRAAPVADTLEVKAPNELSGLNPFAALGALRVAALASSRKGETLAPEDSDTADVLDDEVADERRPLICAMRDCTSTIRASTLASASISVHLFGCLDRQEPPQFRCSSPELFVS